MSACLNGIQEMSCARGIRNAWWKTSSKQESRDLGFFKNMELFLEYAFVLLPGVVERSEFTPAVVMEKHVFATCGLFLWLNKNRLVILLNPQEYNLPDAVTRGGYRMIP